MKPWFAAALALLAASCASPEAAFYTLRPTPGTAQPGGPSPVEVRRPSIPGYLDRPEIVRDSTGFRLRLDNADRWGEPFGDMLGRVFAEDLAQRLPGSSVFTEAGSISADPAVTVEVDVQRFDVDPGSAIVLNALVAVERAGSHDPAASRPVRLTLRPAGTGTNDVVSTMSQLLGQLSDQVAAAVRALPLPATPAAPAPTRRRR